MRKLTRELRRAIIQGESVNEGSFTRSCKHDLLVFLK